LGAQYELIRKVLGLEGGLAKLDRKAQQELIDALKALIVKWDALLLELREAPL